ncbi:MAG: hypothetical protein K2X27_27935 [Candidatus Obscuribacterales bacterium]|nr:hypothetical protein [Candidatus Obscuribacterales bacterium]
MMPLKVLLQTLSTAIITLLFSVSAGAQENVLAIGKAAKGSTATSIPLNLPVEFNYKTRAEILAMRSREVAKFPSLFNGKYIPNNSIFGAIEDAKPWWGTAGAAVFDSGDRSMLGPSEESRFVMNPYLLVAANPGALGIWNPGLFTKTQINDPSFPFFWQPSSLKIDPLRSLGTVSYNISEFQRKIHATKMLRMPVQINRFSLVAYNARDFGYKFIYFNPDKSINVLNDNPTTEAVFIRQFIHCGGTCGCSTTCCNNMSPFIEEIDRLRITRLPARAVVYLWKESPSSIKSNPDMVFLLEFR